MDLEALKRSLRKHEDVKTLPYTCTAGKLTIGIGHRLDKPLSNAAIEQILEDDIADFVKELDRITPSWRDHSPMRQNVIAEMAFNLGISGVMAFSRMWTALRQKDYDAAAREMLDSKWAKQVGQRAITLADQMKRG